MGQLVQFDKIEQTNRSPFVRCSGCLAGCDVQHVVIRFDQYRDICYMGPGL